MSDFYLRVSLKSYPTTQTNESNSENIQSFNLGVYPLYSDASGYATKLLIDGFEFNGKRLKVSAVEVLHDLEVVTTQGGDQ